MKPNTNVKLPCSSYCHELLDFVPVTSTQFVLPKEHKSEFTNKSEEIIKRFEDTRLNITKLARTRRLESNTKPRGKRKTIPLKNESKNNSSSLWLEKYSPIKKKQMVISNHLDPNFHHHLIAEKY